MQGRITIPLKLFCFLSRDENFGKKQNYLKAGSLTLPVPKSQPFLQNMMEGL